jgi:HD-GYP domain-containing protein (c-di-GMP phosphodiesterase class II)
MGCTFDGLPDELLLAGILLHDVGKIFTPKEILYKPGPLSDEEWRIMRRHPADGAEILEQISGLKELAKIVRCHQESYNGSGYPAGLKGNEIPMGARIASAVDAFDAMVTDRPYRKGMPVQKAIDELRRNRGVQFDPLVVDAIISLYEEGTLKPLHDHGSHGKHEENGAAHPVSRTMTMPAVRQASSEQPKSA